MFESRDLIVALPETFLACAGMALLMLGAVISHLKVGDPFKKSLPSLTLLVLSAFVAYANGLLELF